MIPARWPREDAASERLLVVDPRAETFRDARIGELPFLLRPDDLLVLNDAATLPASLAGRGPRGEPIEARLLGELASGTFRAVLLGPGDWRQRTEDRAAPARVEAGDRLAFAGLSATVERVSRISLRLIELRFDRSGADFWLALYRAGRPVQYAYTSRPIELWQVQVAYASRPWAVEMPSAGRPLRWDLLLALRARGTRFARVTHAAGLSSTGDAALDAALPLPERFEIPPGTVEAVASAHRAGGRVIAVGTSVARALEGAAQGGALIEGTGETDLVIGPGYRPRVVDGLLTGTHEPSASHFALLHAFAPAALLARASEHAERAGYLTHEFGDSWLVLPRSTA
ncbi:MAG TPA: S-adenosylmethionine:tRNA ribosyltransferase-isomerase [Myxococcales bacterium]|nr:S-adenosylmethionine:tRNA ribosyltransferase-isomerase [Myxococcales bacterium]